MPLAMAARRSWLWISRLRMPDQMPATAMPRIMAQPATGTMKGLVSPSNVERIIEFLLEAGRLARGPDLSVCLRLSDEAKVSLPGMKL